MDSSCEVTDCYKWNKPRLKLPCTEAPRDKWDFFLTFLLMCVTEWRTHIAKVNFSFHASSRNIFWGEKLGKWSPRKKLISLVPQGFRTFLMHIQIFVEMSLISSNHDDTSMYISIQDVLLLILIFVSYYNLLYYKVQCIIDDRCFYWSGFSVYIYSLLILIAHHFSCSMYGVQIFKCLAEFKLYTFTIITHSAGLCWEWDS